MLGPALDLVLPQARPRDPQLQRLPAAQVQPKVDAVGPLRNPIDPDQLFQRDRPPMPAAPPPPVEFDAVGEEPGAREEEAPVGVPEAGS